VRLCRIRDDSGDSLVSFMCDAVKPGAEVRTDKLLNNLPERGYSYIQVGRSAYGDSARAPMPGVCKVESELEMWLGWIRRRQPGAKSITASQLDAYSHRDGCRRLEVG